MNEFEERLEIFQEETRKVYSKKQDDCLDHPSSRPNPCHKKQDSCHCKHDKPCHCHDYPCCDSDCPIDCKEHHTSCGDWIPKCWEYECHHPVIPLPPKPEDCCVDDCCDNPCYGYNDSCVYNQSVAMAYVPRVRLNGKNDLYSLDVALKKGTLFKVLDKPFKGGLCHE